MEGAPAPEHVWYDTAALAPAWSLLPGGPEAWHDGECWQYMGSVWNGQRAGHTFRHRAHPAYDETWVYAVVLDDDSGPQLGAVYRGA